MPKKKNAFRTYDEMVVDKLREIEPASIKQMAHALGHKGSQNIYTLMKKLVSQELIIIDIRNKPYQYTVKERVVSYD